MHSYLSLVIVLNILVHFMLLLSVNHLAGYPQQVLRCFIVAGVGGIYGGLCMLPAFNFLGNSFWHWVFLCIMGLAAFGLHAGGIRRSMLFLLLSLALGGIAASSEDKSIWSVIGCGVVFCIVTYAGLPALVTGQQSVEVELRRGEKREKLLALRDTGNTLRDPVTGERVLVADAASAAVLLGLSRQQLRCPVETVASGVVDGLRLIPYRAVGQPGSMLLAIRMDSVKIGNWQGSAVVAFAPDGLGEGSTYRALTGGMV